MGFERYLAILSQAAKAVAIAAEAAFIRLLDLIRAGATPQAALALVLADFRGGVMEGFRQALEAILQERISLQTAADWRVGRLRLSDRLYADSRAVAATVRAIIDSHLQGPQSARDLAKALYEGYDFKQDPLRVIKPLPAYLQREFDRFAAAKLKTPALRAAYLQAIEHAERGAGQKALEKALKVAFYERNRYLAHRIAQTELHRAYTDKQARELMRQDRVIYVRYRLSGRAGHVPDICDVHARADRYGLGPGIYPKADAPKPPLHPHCLPGDALITACGRVSAVSKRWYDGDMAVIATAGGKKLAATVNHPILTRDGWMAIGALQIGQEVVCRVAGQRPAMVDHQHQNVPARITEIADAFLRSRQVTAREVPIAAPDFHGDGMAGQIAVIWADSQLWDWIDASLHKSVLNFALDIVHKTLPLFGDGVFDLGGKTLRLAANGIMRGGGPPLFHFWRRLIHSQLLRLAIASNRDAVASEITVDGYSRDAEFLGQSQARLAGNVAINQKTSEFVADFSSFESGERFCLLSRSKTDTARDENRFGYTDLDMERLAKSVDPFSRSIAVDKIIAIDFFKFSGHVYNLETDQGHYTSNGIITHNCRCVLSPYLQVPSSVKPAFDPKAERAFLRSLPADEAQKVAGGRAKLHRALQGEPLESIYNQGVDPLYRWKRVGDFG